MEAIGIEKDRSIEQYERERRIMHTKLLEAEALLETTLQITTRTQSELENARAETTSAEIRLNASLIDLQSFKTTQMQLTSQPGAPFYDSCTKAAMVCPIIQSNGHIVSLKAIITKWFQTASPEDGYIHRTYVCPIMQQPTSLASLTVQDRIRHIAQHAGIDTSPPLVFSYMSDEGKWIEFAFHDQLNIITKLCTIQTMQITDSVEQIIIHRNTMAFEIKATLTLVGGCVCLACIQSRSR